jgi:hypothetical protein
MLEFYKSDEAQRAAESSELWGNVVKPIMADNTRKFLREAGEADIRVFELVAGDALDALGYERVATRKGEKGEFSADDIRHFDAENKRLKEEVMSKVDPEDLKRRDRQSGLIQQIRQRQQTGDSMWVSV